MALIVPGVIGLYFRSRATAPGCSTSPSSVTDLDALMMLAHIVLRWSEPDFERPYQTPARLPWAWRCARRFWAVIAPS